MRSRPAVNRELPPDSSSGARSSSSTRFAVSFADSAAHKAAFPPPTTITSYSSATAQGSFRCHDTSIRPYTGSRTRSRFVPPGAEKAVGADVNVAVVRDRPRPPAQRRSDRVLQRRAVVLAQDVDHQRRFDTVVAAGPQLRLAAHGCGRARRGLPHLDAYDARVTLEAGPVDRRWPPGVRRDHAAPESAARRMIGDRAGGAHHVAEAFHDLAGLRGRRGESRQILRRGEG